jgi:DNA-binding LacI/PurR family transcriptional regulator
MAKAKPSSVTMRDVAELAGVSKQTVSTVLNGRPGISAETQARILQAVDTLGYRLDKVASSLRTGRTRTIALLVSDISSPFIARLAVAAEDCANRAGYSLVLHNTHDDVVREAAYFSVVIERKVDGVIFISAADKSPGLDLLRARGIPAVAIDRIPDPYSGPAVMLDNLKTGRLAAEHLLALGHIQLAHISGPPTVRMARDRWQGFQQTVAAQPHLPLPLVEVATGWDYADGFDAMQRVLAADRPLTALFAAGDALAIGAMRAIQDAGLRVPQDISVVGVDDIDSAAYQNPPLTTIRQSITELAQLGLQLLLDLLAGKEIHPSEIVMDPILVVRQSTARASIR